MSKHQTTPVQETVAPERSSDLFRAPHDPLRIPELLASAGDWDCARAAVENGADAIYFGLEKFNARMRARNFTEADLPSLMEFLHRRGVKGYVTFNTLVFANEIAEAGQHLRAMISAGVDAAIVQDIGICRMIRELSPDFPIHASTQMTLTSAAGIEFARALGCQLVVLARECSLKEIEKIQAQGKADCPQSAAGDGAVGTPRSTPPMPLEVFVHGALCVAYSGQCLTSEALGGRSANRGECAQACRMPYDLISDGNQVALGDRRYLLSPQDLAGLEVLPDLVRAGVASLKIEGRLKSPEYVANITRIYRQTLDDLRVTNDDLRAAGQPPRKSEIVNRKYEMEMAFSRGLYTGWFRGINNRELVHARFGKKRGVYLGEVTRVQGETVFVRLQSPLKRGDGVVFDAGHPEEKEEGGRVYEIVRVGRGVPTAPSRRLAGDSEPYHRDNKEGDLTAVSFGRRDVDFSRVHIGDKVWKTSDPELERRLRGTFAGDHPHFQRAVGMDVHGRACQRMTLVVRDECGHVVQVESAMQLVRAERQSLDNERLREQLGRLGGTPFNLGGLNNFLEGKVMLPVSELNRMRRQAVGRLEALRAQPKRWTLNPGSSRGHEARFSKSEIRNPKSEIDRSLVTSAATEIELIVLVRNIGQLEATLRCGVETIYCEFEDPKKYREAVSRVRRWQHQATANRPTDERAIPPSALRVPRFEIWVAPPRIFKTGEEWILEQVRSSDADGYLVRNYDHLKFFADSRRIGDFSLNVANPLAAEYFIHRYGVQRVTASYDLNIAQLESLLQSAPPEWFEITIHQHMPMFHMEHCVFCAFLSNGTDYTNCGRPCDRHDVQLRDRVGALHPLKADAGCRNTVFNARAQTGAEFVSRMLALGARTFRIEFLKETPEQVAKTITKYRQLLRGEITGAQLWRELKLLNQLGVTRGQMG
ncbi:MAG: peptidase U32 [Verrucomicrobia bacterium]|nr:MAG: peptidase U32 [Verrucomicrobiota bacterium]